ncbi:MAG: D-arabinose 5-phosphate isomerase, partial [Candidatus Competibacteraceae bacterium]|nr:D-arabinose 5-phosphate isomerase [Candidatus Competibacteraceae bacterium]
MHPDQLKRLASQVLTLEAQAVEQLKSRIDDGFVHACDLMLHCQGRIVVLGIGKSGHIGGK